MTDYEIGKKKNVYPNGRSSGATRVYEDDKFYLSLGATSGWSNGQSRSENIAWISMPFINESIIVFGPDVEIARQCRTDNAYRKFCEKMLGKAISKYPTLIFSIIDKSHEEGIRKGVKQIQNQLNELLGR
jgi:hypothetical protein